MARQKMKQVALRMTPSEHSKAIRFAKRNKRSFSALVRKALRDFIEGRKDCMPDKSVKDGWMDNW